MTPDIDWRLAWDIAQFSLLGGIGIYLHFELRDRARGTQVEDLRKSHDGRLDALTDRIAKAEGAMGSAPNRDLCERTQQRIARLEARGEGAVTHQDLKAVYTRIEQMDTRLTSQLGAVGGELAALGRLLQTVDTYLRDHPR